MNKTYNSLAELNADLKRQEKLIDNVENYNKFIDQFPQKIARMSRMIDKYDDMLKEVQCKQNELLAEYSEIEICKQAIKEFRKLQIDVNTLRQKVVDLNEEQATLRGLHSQMMDENEQFKKMIRKLNDQAVFQKELKKRLSQDKLLDKLMDESLAEITVADGMVTISRGD